jgi:nucleotide-binding universal stress UspA family protein
MKASLTTILLATDESSDAALAGQAAADISRKTGAQLHVVHVWTDVPPPAYPALVFDDYSRQAKEEARELLRRQVWNAEVAGGSVAGQHLREGRPAEEIIFLAERLEADLVVVGRRGVGRIKRLITGSVSEGVVHRASCPVLVVRGGEQAWPPSRIVVGDDGSPAAMRQADSPWSWRTPSGPKSSSCVLTAIPPSQWGDGAPGNAWSSTRRVCRTCRSWTLDRNGWRRRRGVGPRRSWPRESQRSRCCLWPGRRKANRHS